MINKILPTHKTFGQVCEYLRKDLRISELLAFEGVRGHDFSLMAKDFEVQHQLRPEKGLPVFHAVLSFPPGEKPGDEKIVEIARKYLDDIDISNTQYAMIKHTDRRHLHLHILANLVNNEGKSMGNFLAFSRGIEVVGKLTAEYGLQPETGKHPEQVNVGSLSRHDAIKYRLYQTIKEALPECRRLEDLSKQLLEKGINTRYRYDKETGQRIGVSFQIEGFAFKGSKVDREFSINGLQKTLTLQAEMKQQQELRISMERKPDAESLSHVPRLSHRM